jgi:hypothetical protein
MLSRLLLRGRGVLAAALWLLFAAPVFAQVTPPQLDPTHYWTYRLLAPVPGLEPIDVSDQFFRQPVPVSVDRLERLLNWVVKDGSAVRDTFLHYTWWNIPQQLPAPRTVVVTNQFGSQLVQVQRLAFLLAPAWKNVPQPIPPPANHYLCYRVIAPPLPQHPRVLMDEWREDVQLPGPIEFLCNPCLKRHQGQIFPPVDTLTHLAVYPIQPQSDVFQPILADQFFTGQVPVRQLPPEYLFVPSEKIDEPTGALPRTWGRLKTLYR